MHHTEEKADGAKNNFNKIRRSNARHRKCIVSIRRQRNTKYAKRDISELNTEQYIKNYILVPN